MQYTQTIRSIYIREYSILVEENGKSVQIPVSRYLLSFLWLQLRRFSPNVSYLSLSCFSSILASMVSIHCKSVHCAYRIYLNVQSFSYRIAAFDTVIENWEPNKMTTTKAATATKYVRYNHNQPTNRLVNGGWWMVKSTFAFRNKIRNQTWFYDLFIIRIAVVHSKGTHCIGDGWCWKRTMAVYFVKRITAHWLIEEIIVYLLYQNIEMWQYRSFSLLKPLAWIEIAMNWCFMFRNLESSIL